MPLSAPAIFLCGLVLSLVQPEGALVFQATRRFVNARAHDDFLGNLIARCTGRVDRSRCPGFTHNVIHKNCA